MFDLKKITGLAAAMLLATGIGASAAPVLSLDPGKALQLPAGSDEPFFNPDPAVPGVSAGDWVTLFDSDNAGSGLRLNGGPAILRFTFLGKEAGYLNAVFLGAPLFDTDAVAGVTFVDVHTGVIDGLLDFGFSDETGAVATNGGAYAPNTSIAFLMQGNKALAFFNDSAAGQADWDDMVVSIQVVPLPAAAWLMIAGIGGLGLMARRRKAMDA